MIYAYDIRSAGWHKIDIFDPVSISIIDADETQKNHNIFAIEARNELYIFPQRDEGITSSFASVTKTFHTYNIELISYMVVGEGDNISISITAYNDKYKNGSAGFIDKSIRHSVYYKAPLGLKGDKFKFTIENAEKIRYLEIIYKPHQRR
jgi:hypothetical protein